MRYSLRSLIWVLTGAAICLGSYSMGHHRGFDAGKLHADSEGYTVRIFTITADENDVTSGWREIKRGVSQWRDRSFSAGLIYRDRPFAIAVEVTPDRIDP